MPATWTCGSADHRGVPHPAVRQRQGHHPRDRAGADGRRIRRDRDRGRPAAQGDVALFPQRAPDLAADLRDLGGARLLRPALHVRAAAPPHHREHDGVPRRSGKPRAHHRGQPAPRRDRHRRARARRHAARHRLDAAAEEPPRRARARGVEDQPRSAQPARLGAAVLRPPGEASRSAGAALRAEADAGARARDRLLPVDAVLWPRPGAAARPPAGRAGRPRRRGARHHRPLAGIADRMDHGGRAAA